MYAPKRELVAATRLGDGLKKDVLAEDTSTVFKLIYVAIPDQPLTRSVLGLKNNMRCSSSSPSWALAGPRLFPLPAPHALLPLRKTRLLLLQPTWLHLPLLPLAYPWLPPAPLFLYLCL